MSPDTGRWLELPGKGSGELNKEALSLFQALEMWASSCSKKSSSSCGNPLASWEEPSIGSCRDSTSVGLPGSIAATGSGAPK